MANFKLLVINFTDNGFASTTTGRTGEGFLTYTAPNAVNAGTVLTWTNGMTITGTGWSSNNPTSFAFNGSGDQLIIFQINRVLSFNFFEKIIL